VDTAVNEKENVLAITAEIPGVWRHKQDIKVNVSDRYCIDTCRKRGQEISY
jgi:HSP20 family molecular chaperone IbpA